MADERVRTKIPAEFSAGHVSGKGEVRNVSAGGLFVGTLAIPEEGTPVKLTLTAPGKVPVEVNGLVWWTAPAGRAKPCGFGLRVLDDDEGYRCFVDTCCERR
jgi:uncharacterized protein (TIGR02266 family)